GAVRMLFVEGALQFRQVLRQVGEVPVEQVFLRLRRLGQRAQERGLAGVRHAEQRDPESLRADGGHDWVHGRAAKSLVHCISRDHEYPSHHQLPGGRMTARPRSPASSFSFVTAGWISATLSLVMTSTISL